MKTTRIALNSLFLLIPVLGGVGNSPHAFAPHAALAQEPETTPVSASTLANIKLPSGAVRINKNSVPGEVTEALDTMMKEAGDKVKRGASEVIAWSGNGYSLKNVPRLKSAIAASFKNGGWTYEETAPEPSGFTAVSALKTVPPRKGLIGFWMPGKDLLLLAWTEMLPANTAPAGEPATEKVPTTKPLTSAPTQVQDATTSALTGIKMPRGGAAFDGANANFTDVLKALAKEEIVKQTPAGAAEVFAWRGENYKPNRTPFTKTAIASALTAAGYSVKEISRDELRDVNVFAHFDGEDKSLPFRPTVLKQPSFFQASSEVKGQAVLGAWIEDDDALALALMPVTFKAAVKAAPLPEVETGAILVKDFNDPLKGVAPKLPTFPTLTVKPGTARGIALDGAGKPIPNVEIAVHSSAAGGIRTTHKARTNAQGIYEVLVPAGIAEVVEAKANISYNGKNYELFLHPVAGEAKQFNSKDGRVENFVLRTSNEYGGNIRVLHGIPEGGTIEITVKPVGKQMDGSAGRTFVYRYPSGIGTSEKFLNFLPLGRYTLTARLLDDGEALPIRVGRTFGSDEERELKTSIQVDFESGYDALSGNTGKSRIRAFQVSLKP